MTTRSAIQGVSTLLTNGYLKGFVTGKIFTGATKYVCVPTLNCYSCPGALFACPVGAVQVILAGGGGLDLTATQSLEIRIKAILSGTPLFVIGFLTIIGALAGRASCGWLCPFGWLQDLLAKVPLPKFRSPPWMGWLKYVFLIVMVILMPLFWTDKMGFSDPAYCKLICPAGTLEGGIPLPLLNPDLRGMLGKLFAWKMSVFLFFLAMMMMTRRPFCSWACPLGAYLGIFNRVSVYRLEFDREKCIHCQACQKVCPAGLHVETDLDSADCIRCLDCTSACQHRLIRVTPAIQILEPPPQVKDER